MASLARARGEGLKGWRLYGGCDGYMEKMAFWLVFSKFPIRGAPGAHFMSEKITLS